jgi:hypothetical protein
MLKFCVAGAAALEMISGSCAVHGRVGRGGGFGVLLVLRGPSAVVRSSRVPAGRGPQW